MADRRVVITSPVGAGVGVAMLGTVALRPRPAVREVGEELRSPWLRLPVWAPRKVDGPVGRFAFALARRGLGQASTPRPGVLLERREIPPGPGEG